MGALRETRRLLAIMFPICFLLGAAAGAGAMAMGAATHAHLWYGTLIGGCVATVLPIAIAMRSLYDYGSDKMTNWLCHKRSKHKWSGCICQRCYTKREHIWDGCICINCRYISDINHNWNRYICTKCNRSHNWSGGICIWCGSSLCAVDVHNWSCGSCTRCGEVCLHSEYRDIGFTGAEAMSARVFRCSRCNVIWDEY